MLGLDARRARRQVREAMPHALSRAGAKLDSTAKTEKIAPEAAGGHVGDGHEALALGELDDQLILLAPAAEAMRVSVSAGRSGRERCVPAAQSRRMPERALGLLLTSGGWWVGRGSKAAHEAKGGNA